MGAGLVAQIPRPRHHVFVGEFGLLTLDCQPLRSRVVIAVDKSMLVRCPLANSRMLKRKIADCPGRYARAFGAIPRCTD